MQKPQENYRSNDPKAASTQPTEADDFAIVLDRAARLSPTRALTVLLEWLHGRLPRHRALLRGRDGAVLVSTFAENAPTESTVTVTSIASSSPTLPAGYLEVRPEVRPADMPSVRFVASAIAHVLREEAGVVGSAGRLGLPGPSAYEQIFRSASVTANRTGQKLILYVVNFDRIGELNKVAGRDAGDQALRAGAMRLSNCVRASDNLIHLGDDEFAIVSLQGDDPQIGAKLAQRLLDAIGQPVGVFGRSLNLTACLGIAVWPTDGFDSNSLLNASRDAMRRAKANGIGTFDYCDSQIAQRVRERVQLEGELREAIADDKLVLHYQPRVNAAGKVVGVESLLRWPHPVHGLMSADQFVPIAEEARLLAPLARTTLRQACRQAKKWADAGKDYAVSVNISASQFLREEFVDQVREALDATELDPGRLEVELVEQLFAQSTIDLARRFHELRFLGVRLTIDDFGTGYSNFVQL
ncbi:MAG TPA: EAL domain-containing protein, partial [Tepidisphaeraceae bacterium]|nr:EAL domain-containing protein [Tepidisphaeraceae bacterium]